MIEHRGISPLATGCWIACYRVEGDPATAAAGRCRRRWRRPSTNTSPYQRGEIDPGPRRRPAPPVAQAVGSALASSSQGRQSLLRRAERFRHGRQHHSAAGGANAFGHGGGHWLPPPARMLAGGQELHRQRAFLRQLQVDPGRTEVDQVAGGVDAGSSRSSLELLELLSVVTRSSARRWPTATNSASASTPLFVLRAIGDHVEFTTPTAPRIRSLLISRRKNWVAPSLRQLREALLQLRELTSGSRQPRATGFSSGRSWGCR